MFNMLYNLLKVFMLVKYMKYRIKMYFQRLVKT